MMRLLLLCVSALAVQVKSKGDESSWLDGWVEDAPSRGQKEQASSLFPGAECDRKCGGPPRNCYFHFTLERYTVLSPACGNCSSGVEEDCSKPQCIVGDGFPRPLQTVNRALPGTPIVVCQNDIVIVDVENMMMDLSTTIHWHGIRQYGTPHMDGVPMVTQCPIQPFTTFRYRFQVPEAGTYFYHSHVGPQKLDGLEGALIVRGNKARELHGNLYDFDLTEHMIVVQDWLHVTGDYYVPGQHIPSTNQIPDAVLINGIGPLSRNGSNDFVPMAKFRVKQGNRYRFRLIGATCMTCLYGLRIQSHQLTVITTDGGLNIKPAIFDSISINSGDRFDFVLTANQSVDSYYIYVENLNQNCGSPGELRQVGVLEYEGSNAGLSVPSSLGEDFGMILNPPFVSCNGSQPNQICVSQLFGEFSAPKVAGTNANYQQIPIAWGKYTYNLDELFAPNSYRPYEEPVYNDITRYLNNNVSFTFPPSPLLTQFKDIPKEKLCSQKCYSNSYNMPCICTSYYSIPLNTVVDLIIYDGSDGTFVHPFHLHGTNVFVTQMGVFPSLNQAVVQKTVKELMVNASQDVYNIRSRPQKDTISVPAGGWVIVRFIADNPGYWMLHCHFLYHLESGMGTILKIGRKMPHVPRNFPKCGNFLD